MFRSKSPYLILQKKCNCYEYLLNYTFIIKIKIIILILKIYNKIYKYKDQTMHENNDLIVKDFN